MDIFKFSPLSSLKSIKFSNTKVINWEVQQINKNFSYFSRSSDKWYTLKFRVKWFPRKFGGKFVSYATHAGVQHDSNTKDAKLFLLVSTTAVTWGLQRGHDGTYELHPNNRNFTPEIRNFCIKHKHKLKMKKNLEKEKWISCKDLMITNTRS